jgi:protoporphyrinogen oxidase
MVGCGYGFLESMPAPYIIKLMKTFAHDNLQYNINPLHRRDFFKQFKGGWQNLWTAYAKARGFNILTNAPVKRITRGEGEPGQHFIDVSYGTDDATLKKRFDRVIVTVPHKIADLMELTDEERDVFSHVKTIPYKVTLLAIDNLTRGHHLWIREHATQKDRDGRSNDGNVVLLSNPHKENNVYIAYQFTEQGKTSDDLRAILLANVKQIGGQDAAIVLERTFDYFPHFTLEGFRQQAHTRFEALQGVDGVYYTGALANFETVKFAGDHAAQLIDTHF